MERFHSTSNQLQSVNIDLATVVPLYKTLMLYVSSMRDMYDIYEKKQDSNQKTKNIKIEFSKRKNEN